MNSVEEMGLAFRINLKVADEMAETYKKRVAEGLNPAMLRDTLNQSLLCFLV